jgi:hypothetical protein
MQRRLLEGAQSVLKAFKNEVREFEVVWEHRIVESRSGSRAHRVLASFHPHLKAVKKTLHRGTNADSGNFEEFCKVVGLEPTAEPFLLDRGMTLGNQHGLNEVLNGKSVQQEDRAA